MSELSGDPGLLLPDTVHVADGDYTDEPVEQWFSILQRKRLTAPDFEDIDALEERLLAFIEEWNESAHPFAWTTKSFVLAKADTAIAAAA